MDGVGLGTPRGSPEPAALKGLGAVPQNPADVPQDGRSTGRRWWVLPSNSGRGQPPPLPLCWEFGEVNA
jgi:hypothetical protein